MNALLILNATLKLEAKFPRVLRHQNRIELDNPVLTGFGMHGPTSAPDDCYRWVQRFLGAEDYSATPEDAITKFEDAVGAVEAIGDLLTWRRMPELNVEKDFETSSIAFKVICRAEIFKVRAAT